MVKMGPEIIFFLAPFIFSAWLDLGFHFPCREEKIGDHPFLERPAEHPGQEVFDIPDDESPVFLVERFRGAALYVKGNGLYKVELKKSDSGNIVCLENTVNGLDEEADEIRQKTAGYHTEMENAKMEYEKEFQYEDLLKAKLKWQTEINSQLEIKKENDVVDNVPEEIVAAPQIAAVAR